MVFKGYIAALNKAKTYPAYAGLAQLSLILSEQIGRTENCMSNHLHMT